jgi:tRNA(Leu) C34 or U34 (ribose-2'-O)-methylase TrmL
MAIELALYQPDIAANTGTLLRLGACLDVRRAHHPSDRLHVLVPDPET